MSIQRQRGNAHERAVASRLGTTRTGQYGGVDVPTEAFAVECKERQAIPLWLHDAVDQAIKHARPGQLPLVWLHQLGKRHDNDYVVIRAKEFQEWFGDVGRVGSGGCGSG